MPFPDPGHCFPGSSHVDFAVDAVTDQVDVSHFSPAKLWGKSGSCLTAAVFTPKDQFTSGDAVFASPDPSGVCSLRSQKGGRSFFQRIAGFAILCRTK